MGEMDAPGPGIFPLAVGVLSFLVSLGVIVDARLTKDPGSATFPTGPDARRLGLIFAAFVLYVASLSLVGLPIATTLFVAFYVRTVGKISWIWSGISGVGVAVAIWAVFELLLAVRLPTRGLELRWKRCKVSTTASRSRFLRRTSSPRSSERPLALLSG